MARNAVTPFLKVKCKDCENEQVVFSKAATRVACNVCGTTLAEPRGGRAQITGDVVSQHL